MRGDEASSAEGGAALGASRRPNEGDHSARCMPVDGAKCQMLVEGVLKEWFAEGGEKKAYNKARVGDWARAILANVCEKMSAMEEEDFKFIGASRSPLSIAACEPADSWAGCWQQRARCWRRTGRGTTRAALGSGRLRQTVREPAARMRALNPVCGAGSEANARCAGAVAVKHEVSRALSAIVSVFWVDSQTNNVPAPADHALDPSVVKDLAEQNIVEVARELSCYDHQACKESAQTLMGGLTQSLVDLGKPFKYIGACARSFWLALFSARDCGQGVWKLRR